MSPCSMWMTGAAEIVGRGDRQIEQIAGHVDAAACRESPAPTRRIDRVQVLDRQRDTRPSSAYRRRASGRNARSVCRWLCVSDGVIA